MQTHSIIASRAGVENKVVQQTSQNNQKNTQSANIKSALSSATLSKENIEDLRKLGGKGITQFYMLHFQQETLNLSSATFNAQNTILDLVQNFASSDDRARIAQAFSNVDFAALSYTGKNPLTMNQDELNALISENGFFGVNNTANRIADFVIQGGGNDLQKLQKGFEGMKRGFEQAEKIWGAALPKISQDTIDKAIAKVSGAIEELGGKAVSINA